MSGNFFYTRLTVQDQNQQIFHSIHSIIHVCVGFPGVSTSTEGLSKLEMNRINLYQMLVRRELFHQGSSWLGQMGLGKLWQGPQQMEPLAPFYFCAFKRNDHKRAQQNYFVNKFMFVFSIGGPKNQFGPSQKGETQQSLRYRVIKRDCRL